MELIIPAIILIGLIIGCIFAYDRTMNAGKKGGVFSRMFRSNPRYFNYETGSGGRIEGKDGIEGYDRQFCTIRFKTGWLFGHGRDDNIPHTAVMRLYPPRYKEEWVIVNPYSPERIAELGPTYLAMLSEIQHLNQMSSMSEQQIKFLEHQITMGGNKTVMIDMLKKIGQLSKEIFHTGISAERKMESGLVEIRDLDRERRRPPQQMMYR